MNTLKVFVKQVIKKPVRVNTDTIAGFKVVVLAGDGYGPFKKKDLWFTHLEEAEEVKKGYTIGYE